MIMAEFDWAGVLRSAFSSPYIVPISGIFCAIVFVLAITWSQARATRLKEKMIERGFTADEIEQVLKAGKK